MGPRQASLSVLKDRRWSIAAIAGAQQAQGGDVEAWRGPESRGMHCVLCSAAVQHYCSCCCCCVCCSLWVSFAPPPSRSPHLVPPPPSTSPKSQGWWRRWRPGRQGRARQRRQVERLARDPPEGRSQPGAGPQGERLSRRARQQQKHVLHWAPQLPGFKDRLAWEASNPAAGAEGARMARHGARSAWGLVPTPLFPQQSADPAH